MIFDVVKELHAKYKYSLLKLTNNRNITSVNMKQKLYIFEK